MYCPNCGKRMRKEKGDYKYVESGLRNIILHRIEIYRCRHCGEVIPKIPQVKELHRAIAEHLFKKDSLLSGEEIRFLRKQMDLRAVDLAAILGVTKVTVSRWETGKERISPPADRAIRLLYRLLQDFDTKDVLKTFSRIRRRKESQKLAAQQEMRSDKWAIASSGP
ncbi:MAG: helix-turn-helix domain-containing protein [Acidobacteria bacterium]|nr:MAG: helix-turn-helix domain-containing protein [Acidobacteriota bacterium]